MRYNQTNIMLYVNYIPTKQHMNSLWECVCVCVCVCVNIYIYIHIYIYIYTLLHRHLECCVCESREIGCGQVGDSKIEHQPLRNQ